MVLFCFQYVVQFCILKFDSKKGTAEATLPVPDPSQIEECSNIKLDNLLIECKKHKMTIKDVQ